MHALRELGQEVAPEDFLDMVNRLENKLKLQELRSQAVAKEVQEYKLLNRQTEETIQSLEVESARIRAITGYIEPHKQNSSRRKYHVCHTLSVPEQDLLQHVCFAPHKKNTTPSLHPPPPSPQELAYLVDKIKTEVKLSREKVSHKDKVVDAMQGKETDFDGLNERLFQLRNKLNSQQQELDRVDEEYETYRKQHLRSDRLISRLENTGDSGCLSSLLKDNLFLKAKINEHVEMRRMQDKAVKAQSFRLQQLQKRADMIANGVEDLKLTDLVSGHLKGAVQVTEEPLCSLDIETILPSDETVDAALYELLARDVEAINNSVDLKYIIIGEKDATVVALEEKVERVLHQNNEETQLKHEDNIAFEANVRDLNKVATIILKTIITSAHTHTPPHNTTQEVRQEREAYQQEIASLRTRKCVAQKKVQRAQTGKQGKNRN